MAKLIRQVVRNRCRRLARQARRRTFRRRVKDGVSGPGMRMLFRQEWDKGRANQDERWLTSFRGSFKREGRDGQA